MSSTASASSASTNGGMARSNTTARPGSSTSQPMIRSVSGHSFSAEPVIRREAVLAAGDHRRRGAVAEQGRGDDCRGIVAIEADRDRAGLDGDEQPVAAGIRGGEPRGDREAVDAAGAAEAEDRDAANVVAQADAAGRRGPRGWASRCRWSRR